MNKWSNQRKIIHFQNWFLIMNNQSKPLRNSEWKGTDKFLQNACTHQSRCTKLRPKVNNLDARYRENHGSNGRHMWESYDIIDDIYGFCLTTFLVSHPLASNSCLNVNGKGPGRKPLHPTRRFFLGIWLVALRNTTKSPGVICSSFIDRIFDKQKQVNHLFS